MASCVVIGRYFALFFMFREFCSCFCTRVLDAFDISTSVCLQDVCLLWRTGCGYFEAYAFYFHSAMAISCYLKGIVSRFVVRCASLSVKTIGL